MDAIPTYKDPCPGSGPDYPFTLTSGGRLPGACHSRLHDVPWLRSLRPAAMADINSGDAASMGIKTGDMIELYNDCGSITAAANPSICILPGNIHLHHDYRECNANDIVFENHLDPYTGFPGFKSIGCHMKKVGGGQNE